MPSCHWIETYWIFVAHVCRFLEWLLVSNFKLDKMLTGLGFLYSCQFADLQMCRIGGEVYIQGTCFLSSNITILFQCSSAPEMWPLCPLLFKVLLCHMLRENWWWNTVSRAARVVSHEVRGFGNYGCSASYSCLGEAGSKTGVFWLKWSQR